LASRPARQGWRCRPSPWAGWLVRLSPIYALGSLAEICDAIAISALPPKADMCGALVNVAKCQ